MLCSRIPSSGVIFNQEKKVRLSFRRNKISSEFTRHSQNELTVNFSFNNNLKIFFYYYIHLGGGGLKLDFLNTLYHLIHLTLTLGATAGTNLNHSIYRYIYFIMHNTCFIEGSESIHRETGNMNKK